METNEIIKELRLKKRWSQTQLANKLGYKGRSEISKIENGTRRITSSMIVNLAKVFDVPPSVFVSDGSDKTVKLSTEGEELNDNTIIVRGRDGSVTTKTLTDKQLHALQVIIDQFADAPDDL